MVSDIADDNCLFHFQIAWPEVFTPQRGGFDVVIGNPPYLGGPSISGTLGEKVLQFLKVNHPATSGGRVDLAAYFLRRGFDLVRDGGELCFITTKSIAEGDTLEAGLSLIVNEWAGSIADAISSVPWEGAAVVSVSAVHLHRGSWNGQRSLNGRQVEYIGPALDVGSGGMAAPLRANSGLIFKGSNPLGTGFQLKPDRANRLLQVDPRNGEVVRPFFGSTDLVQSADLQPRRWIIDFGGRSAEEASSYREPFEIVEALVHPEREAVDASGAFKVKRQAYRDRWWQLAERSARLYREIAGLQRVIAIPEVSKVMLPIFVSTGAVYYQTIFVIASDDYGLFGLLTSSFHWLWAARGGGASTLDTGPRYHQERCFETLARPGLTDAVVRASVYLDKERTSMMIRRREGLTKIYNRLTDVAQHDDDVERLRRSHVELDLAVADAYGWTDIEFDHGVHDHPRFGKRWLPKPAAQREIERCLFALNAERSASERVRSEAS